jgi:hypothetical protein
MPPSPAQVHPLCRPIEAARAETFAVATGSTRARAARSGAARGAQRSTLNPRLDAMNKCALRPSHARFPVKYRTGNPNDRKSNGKRQLALQNNRAITGGHNRENNRKRDGLRCQKRARVECRAQRPHRLRGAVLVNTESSKILVTRVKRNFAGSTRRRFAPQSRPRDSRRCRRRLGGQYGVLQIRANGKKANAAPRTMVPAHGSARVGATVAAASIAAARRGGSNNFLLDTDSVTAA